MAVQPPNENEDQPKSPEQHPGTPDSDDELFFNSINLDPKEAAMPYFNFAMYNSQGNLLPKGSFFAEVVEDIIRDKYRNLDPKGLTTVSCTATDVAVEAKTKDDCVGILHMTV